MIAIDTNVLLRYLLQDDQKQSKKAVGIITGTERVLVPDVVLAETIWTLTGKRYGVDKEMVCRVVRGLLGDNAFQFEDIQVVWTALCAFEESVTVRGKALDFADSLIVAKAQEVLRQHGESEPTVYSFDKTVHQLDGASDL